MLRVRPDMHTAYKFIQDPETIQVEKSRIGRELSMAALKKKFQTIQKCCAAFADVINGKECWHFLQCGKPGTCSFSGCVKNC